MSATTNPALASSADRTTTEATWKLPNDTWSEETHPTEHLHSLHEYLKRSLQMQNVMVLAGSGTSLGQANGPSMADLWEACTTLGDFNDVTQALQFDTGNKNIEDLLSSAESYLQVYPNSDSHISRFLRNAKGKILSLCTDFDPDLNAHKLFLSKLSARRPYSPRVKLFTTNYDTCFETAASSLGQIIIDGFSFNIPRTYDPRYFDYDVLRGYNSVDGTPVLQEGVIRLYKLHGSVNWERHQQSIRIADKPDADKVCIIYPAKEKYQQSYIQPHLELISQYLVSLRQPETCVLIIGFGLNDNHLSEPLIGAIESNPRARFIFVSPSMNDEEHLRQHPHLRRVLEAQQRGADVAFIAATFSKFADLLPDLTALSPDEQLVRAVRQVAAGTANAD